MTTQLIKNLLALEKALSTPPKTVRAVQELSVLHAKNMRALLSLPPPEDLSLAELRRLTKRGGGVWLRSKAEQRAAERLGARLVRAKKAARRRRQREARAALALLVDKDVERAEIARQTWKRRLRAPPGSTETDRLIIGALWPAAWYSTRQIHERTDWTKISPTARPRPSLSWLGVPLARLERLGVVEKVVRGDSYRYRTGAKGRQSTHFFRLTPAGASLHDDIEVGLVPEWSSMVRVKPRPVGVNPGEQKTLCAMAPGQWWSIGDICRALGLSWRHKSERQAIANALRRHLVPAGAVTKAQNPDWQGPGREEPKFLFRLTDRGEQAREGLVLIG
jgi:hypothetical protein